MFAAGKQPKGMSQKPRLAGTALMTLWTGEVLKNPASASDPLCVTPSPILTMQGGAGVFTEAFFALVLFYLKEEEPLKSNLSPHLTES